MTKKAKTKTKTKTTKPSPPKTRGGSTTTPERRAELGWGPRMTMRLHVESYDQLGELAASLVVSRASVLELGLAALAASHARSGTNGHAGN